MGDPDTVLCVGCAELPAIGTHPLVAICGRCEFCARAYGEAWGLEYTYDHRSLAYRVALEHATAPIKAAQRACVAFAPVVARALLVAVEQGTPAAPLVAALVALAGAEGHPLAALARGVEGPHRVRRALDLADAVLTLAGATAESEVARG